MDFVEPLLCGLIISHLAIYYQLGTFNQTIKQLKAVTRMICKKLKMEFDV